MITGKLAKFIDGILHMKAGYPKSHTFMGTEGVTPLKMVYFIDSLFLRGRVKIGSHYVALVC